MRKRNCTPVAGLNPRTAVSENSTVTSLESDEQRSLFKDESLFTKQNTGPNACRNNNMGEKDSSHQTLLKDDKSSSRNVLEQSPSTETKTTDKDDAVLMSTLFKESRVNSKDQIFKREWPPKEPARQNSPALGGSSREQLVTARNRTWLDRQPSISPVDFNDSFWDQ
ncbi:uncharacterized protein LOC135469393 [Liolophura sinensis]|uniref:uncharacterized protein LOC135469393 n=1 Tax=Liolophura sinensis TaxID=3198878 RepID=UPI0031582795